MSTKSVPEPTAITLLSREQLAAQLGCSTWSITYWVQRGILPQPIKFAGNVHKWRVVDIEKALERLQRAPYSPPTLRGKVKAQHLTVVQDDEEQEARPKRERVRLTDACNAAEEPE